MQAVVITGRAPFEQWTRLVDTRVSTLAGVRLGDMTDANLRDWYDSGASVHEAADMALENAGWQGDERD